MRFMVIRKADEETEAGMLPSTELLEAMQPYEGGGSMISSYVAGGTPVSS